METLNCSFLLHLLLFFIFLADVVADTKIKVFKIVLKLKDLITPRDLMCRGQRTLKTKINKYMSIR